MLLGQLAKCKYARVSEQTVVSMTNFQALILALWLRKGKSLFLGHTLTYSRVKGHCACNLLSKGSREKICKYLQRDRDRVNRKKF